MSLKTKTRCHAAFIILIHRTVMTCLCLLAVSVQVAAQQEVVYEQVRKLRHLVAGNRYIVVAAKEDMAMGWQDGNNRKAVSITGTRKDSVITGIAVATAREEKDKVYEFILGGETGKWTFYDDIYQGYLYAASQNDKDNCLYLEKTASSNRTKASVGGKIDDIKVTFAPNDKSLTHKVLAYNSTSRLFSCYTSYSAITLYRKRVGLLSISRFGSATYNSPEYSYEMPEGCVGYAVTCGEDSLTLVGRYCAGDAVPANTPLLIQGAEGIYHLYETARTAASLEDGGNLLHADFDADGNITYDIGNRESNYYYKLGTRGGENIGFYWGAEDGAPFRMKGTERAYLVLPRQRSQVRGLVLDEARTETAVTLPGHIRKPAGGLHDLSGRPCQGSPAPGIYVRDGRKVIVRR